MIDIFKKELKRIGFELDKSSDWEVWYKTYEDFEIEASKRINNNSDLYSISIKTLSKPLEEISLGTRKIEWLLEFNDLFYPIEYVKLSSPDMYEEKVNKEGRDGCGRE